MEGNFHGGKLIGWETHGFRTIQDLDVPCIMEEAKRRWLRPNEIHAMLSNYSYFNILVRPLILPKGGTIVFFDRSKLRYFRKDGHNWKKKKDGKTLQEAHENLKIGTEEKIHVYYAHGEDNPHFVRRSYWLLDKALEHIVLVHYRETQEDSPFMPVNSGLNMDLLDALESRLLLGENSHQTNEVYVNTPKESIEAGDRVNKSSHDMRLLEIDTLEWDELLACNTYEETFPPKENTLYTQEYDHYAPYNLENNGSNLLTYQIPEDSITPINSTDPQANHSSHITREDDVFSQVTCHQIDFKEVSQCCDIGKAGAGNSKCEEVEDGLQSQCRASRGSYVSRGAANQGESVSEQMFCITDVSPTRACSTEKTKILVVGFFHQEYQHMENSNIFCVCGEICVPAEAVQAGVFRCFVSPQSPGLMDFYLTFDGSTPISQVITLEFRAPKSTESSILDHQSQWNTFRLQMRLAHLLFSTSKSLDILSSKVSHNALDAGQKFALKHQNVADSWKNLTKLIVKGKIPFERAKNSVLELLIKSKMKEWLVERIIDGSKFCKRDSQGQGVLHLCAILDYTWAVYPFSLAGLSLDFRDKFGWTALHWAAHLGREKMVATLLSAGAKPNLVTDPTSEDPGGNIAADLASKQGFEGLAAYLSEKALIQQFEDMKLAGNVSGSLKIASNYYDNPNNNTDEEDPYLKETVTAYCTAADAAARIQLAFTERALRQRAKEFEGSNAEDVAAMKIQHAFRRYEIRKKTVAASRIQCRFRTWKLRKEFLYKRQQAIKIQSVFRGFQVRRQYRKLVWSVGVLEKAVLRWRMKKKGLRGLQVITKDPISHQFQQGGCDGEEDFYRASRKQAEERVERAVVRVQAMFRSRQAQQEYRRMKLAHSQALQLGYEESSYPGCHYGPT